MLISVIVPIYNLEQYVESCITSIIGQTYQQLEILLIDDGSKDRSGFICDEYAKKDARIRVFHKENGGLSDARNYGLDHMKGDAVAFIDGDDMIHPQMMEIMAQIMQREKAQIVACSYERVTEQPKPSMIDASSIETELYSGKIALPLNKGDVIACNKLYQKAVFDGIRYPIGKYHEDEFVIHQILYHCEKMAVISTSLYYYFIRNNSITEKIVPKNIYDTLEALSQRCLFCEEHQWDEALLATVNGYCEYCARRYWQIRHKELPGLGEELAEHLLQCANDMLQQYPNVHAKQQFIRFAQDPDTYPVYLKRTQRNQKVQEITGRICYKLKRILQRIRHGA